MGCTLHLSNAALKNAETWQKAGIALPAFDIAKMREKTDGAPQWIHFGAGNIFRAFPAAAMQRLLDAGLADTGIIACEAFDGDIITKAYAPFDSLSLLCVLKADGTVENRVIASVARALRVDGACEADRKALLAMLAMPSLQMVSFTITEKGYAVRGADGQALAHIQKDIDNKPENAASALGLACAGLHARYLAGGAPVALVSMDNCSHNGDKLREGALFIAEGWRARGHVDAGFVAWLSNRKNVSFPLTMIDKITPRPDEKVAALLASLGFEDAGVIVTDKGTYTAAFVNAEETEYLVVEDDFPNGRPPLEKAGFVMTDRGTVDRVERMKVCTCLNPLHTALAVLGCLLGYDKIFQEMRDPDLAALVRALAFREGMPVVTDPGVISPETFAREVIEKRFSNPFMPDTPQRIATDTSQKLPIRFGETVKAYIASDTLDVASLRCVPFVYAAWLRYLLGISDELTPFAVSPDPRLAEMQALLSDVRVGDGRDYTDVIAPILRRAELFGVDICETGLADKVTRSFHEMLKGRGAVRRALHELIREGENA